MHVQLERNLTIDFVLGEDTVVTLRSAGRARLAARERKKVGAPIKMLILRPRQMALRLAKCGFAQRLSLAVRCMASGTSEVTPDRGGHFTAQ
jgi:hypothetical protein